MSDTSKRRRKPGEGSVRSYETKHGRQWLIVFRTSDPITGSRRQKLVRGFPNERAALKGLRVALTEVDSGKYVEPSKQRLDEYLTTWHDGLRVAESTRASYAKNCRLHIAPHLGATPLASLTAAAINAAYRKLENSGRTDGTGGLSPRTIRYVHTILRHALADAVRSGQLTSNPSDGASPPSPRDAVAPEMLTWTGEQVATFLTWCRTDNGQGSRSRRSELAYGWELLAMTGLRRGEALALRWADVDFSNAQIRVRRSLGAVRSKGLTERLIEGPTKSGRSRVVDVDQRTLNSLRNHRADLAEVSLLLSRDDALVLGDLRGEPRHPDRFSRRFTRTLAAARVQLGQNTLPAIRLHDLRHTHATLLLQAGVHPKIVSERLGHAKIAITMDIYSHAMPTIQREAAEQLADLVYGHTS